MARSKLIISTLSQREGKRYNPADIMQTARRAGIWRGSSGAGRGFYEGKDEGLSIKLDSGLPSRRGYRMGLNQTLDQLGQDSAYEENERGGRIYDPVRGSTGFTGDKYFVRIHNGRSLPEHVIRENVHEFKAFAGGTIYEQGNDIVIESAEIYPIDRNKVYAFAAFMTDRGYPTAVNKVALR